MQLVVKATSIAHRLSVLVSSPERGLRRFAIRTWGTLSSSCALLWKQTKSISDPDGGIEFDIPVSALAW